jgi:hypothetical protein
MKTRFPGRHSARYVAQWTHGLRLQTRILAISIAVLVLVSGLSVLSASGVTSNVAGCGNVCGGTLQKTPKLVLGSVLGLPRADRFWAVADQAPMEHPSSSLAELMNATPISTYRFDGGVDTTNQSTDTGYTDLGTTFTSGLDDAGFVTWCRWTHCRAVMGVPAETNNPGAAAATIRYVEQTLGFHPDYWSIGNEPGAWTHYGIPWTKWSVLDHSSCDAVCYAKDVQRLVPVLKKVDPAARIIGIQDSYCGDDPYLREIVAVDGPNLSAIACHMYPASQFVVPTLDQFYGALSGRWSLPYKMEKIEEIIHTECPGCHLPMFIDEYNAAWFPIPLMGTYANAVFLAASMIQALSVNASQFAFFTLQDAGAFGETYGMISPSGAPMYPYYVYSVFARNLSLKEVVNATIPTPIGGVFSIETISGTHRSLFVVNTNVTHGVTFSTAGSALPIYGVAHTWMWSPGWEVPRSGLTAIGHLPTTWTVPAQSIFLLNLN